MSYLEHVEGDVAGGDDGQRVENLQDKAEDVNEHPPDEPEDLADEEVQNRFDGHVCGAAQQQGDQEIHQAQGGHVLRR
jgi:hypothetical protein